MLVVLFKNNTAIVKRIVDLSEDPQEIAMNFK
jgi:hypothetical protein